MNDKSKSKADTRTEAEELKRETLKNEALEDKELDQVTGGYLKITMTNLKSGASGRNASSGWQTGDFNGDGSFDN